MNTNTTEPAKAVSSTGLLGCPRPSQERCHLAWSWLKEYALMEGSYEATDAFLEWEYQRRDAESLRKALQDLYSVLRDRHHGRMPEEVEKAYNAASDILQPNEKLSD